jgi:branched-chain amino acid aminotransferase
MNFFVYWTNSEGEEELITPPLDGTILPGVTRDSILVSPRQALARSWNEFKVTERAFTIHELVESLEQGRVKEAFGCGTACVVSPVKTIHYAGKDHAVPLELKSSGRLTQRCWEELNKIYYGEVEHPWTYVVS